MLSPTHYEQDCMNICGTVVDHKLLSSDEIQQRYEQVNIQTKLNSIILLQSVSVWSEFSEEPYDFLNSTMPVESYTQKSTYNIAEAVQRQRNFNYQVNNLNI